MKKQISKIMSGTVCATMACCMMASSVYAATFTDVPSSHWASGYITAAANNNYVSGVGNGMFKPNDAVSHAEFHAMITKTFVPNQVEKFKNVNGAWFMPFMEASKAMEYTYSTMMEDKSQWNTIATKPMTRYEMAMLVYNVFDRRAMAPKDPSAAFIKLRDSDNVTDYYISAIANCYTLGVLSGYDDGKFHGDDTVTRAQACAVLIRMDEIINGTKHDISKPQAEPQTETTAKPETPAQKPNSNNGVMTEEKIIAKLKELETRFPDGTNWENEVYNSNEGGGSYYAKSLSDYESINNYARNCAAWSWFASDYVFGTDNPVLNAHHDWKQIKIGDVIAFSTGPNNKPHHWTMVTNITFDEEFNQYLFSTTTSGPDHTAGWNLGFYQNTVDENLNHGNEKASYITVYTRY